MLVDGDVDAPATLLLLDRVLLLLGSEEDRLLVEVELLVGLGRGEDARHVRGGAEMRRDEEEEGGDEKEKER